MHILKSPRGHNEDGWVSEWVSEWAPVHEHMRIQNVRDFPQTKLDSEINAPFLLRLPYTFRSAIFFKFGFLGQSNGWKVISNFWKKNWKKLNIGGEMEVLRYGQK